MTPEDLSDARKLRALNGWMMRHFVRNVALACLLVLGLPRVALARSLDVTAVQIEATVKEDGSLAVVEQRTYDASGSYSGIFWDVHEGVYEGRRVEAEVTRVEAILEGSGRCSQRRRRVRTAPMSSQTLMTTNSSRSSGQPRTRRSLFWWAIP